MFLVDHFNNGMAHYHFDELVLFICFIARKKYSKKNHEKRIHPDIPKQYESL